MKAVIMAGGKGSRLAPLTDHAPKPMMPILDKPILHYIIALLKKHDFTDISVTLGYMANSIVERFGDGRELGVRLRYFIEKEPKAIVAASVLNYVLNILYVYLTSSTE